MSEYSALIVAAGTASRMRPLSDTTHKTLFEIDGRSILLRTIDSIRAVGIRHVVIVIGYHGDQICNAILNCRNCRDLTIDYVENQDYDRTNNAYSCWLARDLIRDRPFILLDSDIVFQTEILRRLIASEYPDCVAVRTTGELGDEEIKILANADQSIRRIGKDIRPELAIGESIGIEKFATLGPTLFRTLDERIRSGFGKSEWYEASFQAMIDEGAVMNWLDIGLLGCMEIDTPTDLDAVRVLARSWFGN